MRYADLIEHFQRAGGGGAGNGNAWEAVVKAGSWARTVDQRVWSGPAATTGTLPDFSLIYEPPAALAPDQAAAQALARSLLQEYRTAGVFDALAGATAPDRAARPRIDSAEYARAITELTGSTSPAWDERLISLLVPELGAARSLARVNAARMHEAASRRDAADFLAAFEQCGALARVCAQQPGAIDRLVACAIASLAAERARAAISAGWTDPAVLDGICGALDRQTAWPSLRLPLEGERLLALDTCRWAFDSAGKPDPRAFAELGAMIAGGVPFDHTALTGAPLDRDATIAEINRAFDILAHGTALNRARRDKVAAEMGAYLDALPANQIVVRLLVPGQLKLAPSEARARSRLAVLRVTIALERHKAVHGTYPESLDAVTRAVDVTDPWTDTPLRYARTGDGYSLDSAEQDDRSSR